MNDDQDLDHGKDIRLATLAGSPLVQDHCHPCCKEPRIPEQERGFRNGACRATNLPHQIAAAVDDPAPRKAMHSPAPRIGVELASWQSRAKARRRAPLDSDMIRTPRSIAHNPWDD